MDTLLPQIGPYHDVKLIGEGGMAVVYRAKDPNQKDVAIKVLKPEYEDITEFQKRFQLEVQALANLDHPHILSVHDYCASGEGPRAYLVTSYLSGGSLQDKLKNQQPLSIQEALRITMQLLDALSYAHSKKLIHRDITPGNILFRGDGSLVLSDFGLVKFLEENPGSDRGLTKTGHIIGTRRYMAPELFRAKAATYRSDLYSVGIILYQMLTGTYPFEKEELLFNDPPRPIREINPTVPAQLEKIVLKALNKYPRQRYRSAAQMRSALQALQFAPSSDKLLQQSDPSPTMPLLNGRRIPLFLAIIIPVLVIAILVGAFNIPAIAGKLFPHSTPLALPTPPPSSVIKIGVDLPLTGGTASSGLPIAGGIQFAIDQANKEHFIPGYTFEEYKSPDQSPNQLGLDDQSDPPTGAANVTKATKDALTAAIIGPYNSGVAQQEMPITNRTPIAQISPSNTNPCLTKDTLEDCKGKNDLLPTVRPTGMTTYFRLPASDELVVKAIVPFLRAKSYQTAYVIYNRNDLYSKFFSQLFVKQWQNGGGTFVAPTDDEDPNSDVPQYQAQLKLLPTSPDVIFYAGTMPAVAKVKQAMDNLPQLNKTAYMGGVVLNQFAQMVGSGGGSVYATAPIGYTTAAQGFEANYLSGQYSQYGYTPYTASAYDCTLIVMQAVKTVIEQDHILPPRGSSDTQGANRFRQAIIKEISSMTADKITGNLTLTTQFQSFDQNGDNTNNYVSIYSLGNSASPWQLQESDPVH